MPITEQLVQYPRSADVQVLLARYRFSDTVKFCLL